MKHFLLLSTLIFSSLTYADTVTLKGGESIYIGGTVVKCEGNSTNTNVGNAQYAQLPWSKLRVLLLAGLGPCRIESSTGSNPQDFFYSSTINGLHVNQSTRRIIRNDIKNGACE